ncbi:sortase [Candidatus Peribacteria bacterium]|nr:sortase [Candidatus Peribacteria bacterium]
MRYHLLSLGVLVLFSTGFLPVTTAAGSYDDAYRFLADAGAIDSSNSSNAPEVISRAELLRVLLDARPDTRARVENARIRLSKLPLFLDVEPSEWYAPYAQAAFTGLVTTGFPDRTLRPNEPVPVEEGITLLMRAFRERTVYIESDTEWFAPFVRAALAKNVVARPRSVMLGQLLTRGQFYDMVYRMSVVERDHLVAFIDHRPPAPVYSPGIAIAAAATQQVQPSAPVDARQYASAQNFAISIPSLGIKDLAVIHPQDAQTSDGLLAPLQHGVGHLFSYPGRGGKIMVYGHSSGYSWDVSKYTKIFRQVNRLRPGDAVYVTYNGTLYVYSVTGQQTISPKDATPFTGQGEELILYTCWPPNSIKQRLIIRASPVETVAVR